MLKKSYLSASYIDPIQTTTYAHNKINAVILGDIDHNGYVDLVTFPSEFSLAGYLGPIAWTNNKGVFSANASVIQNPLNYQYFRDSVAGDFNNDGFIDYFQADQGWELNNRDPNFFYGGEPALLLGSSKRLEWQPLNSWLTNPAGSKTFNHIADAADFDLDGDLDIVIAAFWDLKIYENQGSAKFTQREDTVPVKFNSPNNFGGASGSTFIELNGKYAIAAGTYRVWDANTLSTPISILTPQNGQFVETDTVARPNLGFGRERNYGASDMFNMDMNGDGREDLIITWETEPSGGINDGLSNMSGGKNQRYTDLTNTIISIYFQDENGRLVANNTVYNSGDNTAGAPLFFEDFNLDGYVDFWTSGFFGKPSEFNQSVFINDGRGKFSHPTDMFNISETLPDWYQVSPFFVDANSDGAIDVVAVRPVLAQPPTHTIGQEIRTFLSDRPTYNINSNNRFLAVLADKTFDGGAGIDTGVFSGNLSSYTVSSNSNGVWNTVDKLVGRDGRDGFQNIERLKFTDTSLALDIGPTQNAGSVYMIYKAAFNRASDAGGMGFWLAQKDGGSNIVTNIAQGFVNSAEFTAKYGTNPTNAAYVDKLYQNVLGRTGEAGGVAYWNQELDAGRISKAAVLVQFATLAEGASNVASLIANGIGYTEYVG